MSLVQGILDVATIYLRRATAVNSLCSMVRATIGTINRESGYGAFIQRPSISLFQSDDGGSNPPCPSTRGVRFAFFDPRRFALRRRVW